MVIRDLMRRWLRLPSGLALLLGLGALSAGDARAEMSPDQPAVPAGDLLIRTTVDGLYLSEGGGAFTRLHLGDTPETRALQAVLAQHPDAASGVRISPTILAGGGGAGFSWGPAPTRPPAPATPSPVTTSPAPPTAPAAPTPKQG